MLVKLESKQIWRKLDHGDDVKVVDKKILLQRISGSVDDPIDEFDTQWRKFAAHHCNTCQQIDYIKQIKGDSNDQDKIVVEMDFAENHNLTIQHQIQQAHYNAAQATIFTINMRYVQISKKGNFRNSIKHNNNHLHSDY